MDLLQTLIVPPPLIDVAQAHDYGSLAAAHSSVDLSTQDNHDEASTQTTTEPQFQDKSNGTRQSLTNTEEICFFFYHYGDCKKDPARVKPNEKPCTFSHSQPLPNSRIQIVKRKFHKGSCHLPLCPYKDGGGFTTEVQAKIANNQQKGGKENAKRAEKRLESKHSGEVSDIAAKTPEIKQSKRAAKRLKNKQMEEATAIAAKKPEIKQSRRATPTAPKKTRDKQTEQPVASEHNRKKRRYYTEHDPGRPPASVEKRVRMSYDDLYDDPKDNRIVSPLPEVQPEVQPGAEVDQDPEVGRTCFFWYHGFCQRTTWKRGCPLKHALTDPPSMVFPPPGFVHREPCGLQWCAGDGGSRGQAQHVEVGQQRYFEAAVAAEKPAGGTGQPMDVAELFLKGFEEPGF